MSNGYLVAAEADLAAAHDIADGFGLDVIDGSHVADGAAVGGALAAAANVGLLLSRAAAQDAAFVALMRAASQRLQRAQLILIDADARAAFAFFPNAWPTMAFADAQTRAHTLSRQRQQSEGASQPPRAQPLPSEPAPPTPDPGAARDEEATDTGADDGVREEHAPPVAAAPPELAPETEPAPAPAAPPPAAATPEPPVRAPSRPEDTSVATSAPADATAFAPKKLRRGTPELVRIVVHQPHQLKEVIAAARTIDPRTAPAPSGLRIGEIPLGSSVGVSLDVRGAACDGALQRRIWTGEPIDFAFSAEPDIGVRQAVFLARVFVDDAQIGVLAFTRPVSGPAKNPASPGSRIRLKRHKRVFLSYSSQDRETVAAIATAYARAGVPHFWDRASLKSGEEWSPRLRREIERADLFHLCWSKAAAGSEWVEKEAEYALTRRRRSNGKRPDITVQMLDGPPWAPHPAHLDSINFDDFVRAAIVGYARGEG